MRANRIHTKKIIAVISLLAASALLAGCDSSGLKNVDTIMNSARRVIGGNQKAIDQAEETKHVIEDLNPVFASEEETKVTDAVARQVNELFHKSLDNVFTDSKFVSIQNEGKTPFMMKYVVKRRINEPDGEALQKGLVESDSREKADSNPNYYSNRNTVEFSVYHDFGGRSYILAVVLDLADQSIWISVY